MKTARMMIDVDDGLMKVRVQDEEVTFNLFEAMKHPNDKHDSFRNDAIEEKYHDGKVRHKEFHVGQMVLLFKSRFKLLPGKLKPKGSGPFVVKEVRNYGAIVIEDPKSQESWTVNGQRLKVYHGGDINRDVDVVSLFKPG